MEPLFLSMQVPFTWCCQRFRLASFQSQVSDHKFRMSDVGLNPDIPSAMIQQFGMTFTVTSKPKSVRLSHGILTRQGLSHRVQCTTSAHHSKIISVNSTTTPIFTSVEQCRIRNSNFVSSFFKCGFPVSHPICTCSSKSVHRSLSSGSLSSYGNSMHASRSRSAMRWALLMSKMDISSSSQSAKSQQHFKDSPWGHCTEEFMRKQGSLCPRAQLSRSVCVSSICYYPLDGYNCDASALCFCSTDFLVESTQRIPSIFPACTRFPGSCAPV